MTKINFYNRYNPKPLEKGTDFTGQEEVCNQLAAEECEINKLLNQYAEGQIDELPVVRDVQYNDVMITPQSYEDAIGLIKKVENDFYSLPKDVQRQFGDVKTYVSDITKISAGDSETLAKYGNFTVTSPLQNGAEFNGSAGTSSSSLSASDSEKVQPVSNTPSLEGFAGKES